MATVQLRGTHNRVFVLERGVLDEGALLAFTGSQCHGLGLAIRKQTGWPLVAVDNASGECVHICVRDPEGRLVDVTGAHTDDEVARETKGAIRDVKETYVQRLHAQHDWVPPDIDGAGPFVVPVCERAASEPPQKPLSSSTLRVALPPDDGLQVKIEWSGETYMDVFVCRSPSPTEHWILYRHIGIPLDAETGSYEIDFRPERLSGVFDRWMERRFDRDLAERKLAESARPEVLGATSRSPRPPPG